MRGFGDASPGRDRDPRIEDLVDVMPWPDKEYENVRLVGPVFSVKHVWFDIKTDSGIKRFPKMCLDHDGATDKFVTNICPYRKLVSEGFGNIATSYLTNVISRALQDERDYRRVTDRKIVNHLGYKCYLARKGDTRLTPVRVLVVPASGAETLQNLKKLNKVNVDGRRSEMEISDAKYGIDISIQHDDSKEGSRRYDIQRADRSPLTAEERAYMIYPLNLLKPESLAAAKENLQGFQDRLVRKSKDKDGKSKDGEERRTQGRGFRSDDEDSPRRSNKHSRDSLEDDIESFSEDDLGADLDSLDELDEKPNRNSRNERSASRPNRSREEERRPSRNREERRPSRDEERRPSRNREESRRPMRRPERNSRY